MSDHKGMNNSSTIVRLLNLARQMATELASMEELPGQKKFYITADGYATNDPGTAAQPNKPVELGNNFALRSLVSNMFMPQILKLSGAEANVQAHYKYLTDRGLMSLDIYHPMFVVDACIMGRVKYCPIPGTDEVTPELAVDWLTAYAAKPLKEIIPSEEEVAKIVKDLQEKTAAALGQLPPADSLVDGDNVHCVKDFSEEGGGETIATGAIGVYQAENDSVTFDPKDVKGLAENVRPVFDADIVRKNPGNFTIEHIFPPAASGDEVNPAAASA